jgi:hypothetical protein
LVFTKYNSLAKLIRWNYLKNSYSLLIYSITKNIGKHFLSEWQKCLLNLQAKASYFFKSREMVIYCFI